MNAGDIEGLAGEINGLIAQWEDYGYADPPMPGCRPVPPLGQRSAMSIRAGHKAIDQIDALTRRLHQVREQLAGELRQDSDIRAKRIDEMLASRAGHG